MKKIIVVLISMLLLVSLLAGCSTGSEVEIKNNSDPSFEPVSHEIYGINFPVPDAQWTYMFNVEELGDGEEWIDFEISSLYKDESITVPKNHKTKEIDGKQIYQFSVKEEKGEGEEVDFWDEYILAPQTDGSYIKIVSNFIRQEDRRKADKFYKELLDKIELNDDPNYIVTPDYVSLGGVKVPTEGMEPSEFFFGLAEITDTNKVVSVQVGISDGADKPDLKAIKAYLEEDGYNTFLGGGQIESLGENARWYTTKENIDGESDFAPYLTHSIRVPIDNLNKTVSISYDFRADVDDINMYDDDIKKIDDQIHLAKR